RRMAAAYPPVDERRVGVRMTRTLCEGMARRPRSSPLLRTLVLRGGSDPAPIAVLAADSGVWYCVPCWAVACALVGAGDQLILRRLARTFPQNDGSVASHGKGRTAKICVLSRRPVAAIMLIRHAEQ